MNGIPSPRTSIDLVRTPGHNLESKSRRNRSPGLCRRVEYLNSKDLGRYNALDTPGTKHKLLHSRDSVLCSPLKSRCKKSSAESYLKKLLPSEPYYPSELCKPPLHEAGDVEEPPYLPSSYGLQTSQENNDLLKSFGTKELVTIQASFETPLLRLEEAACEEEQILHDQRMQHPLLQSKQMNSNDQPSLITDSHVIQANFIDIDELIEYEKRRYLGVADGQYTIRGRRHLSDRHFVVLSAGAISNNPNDTSAESDVPICEEMLTSDTHFRLSERAQQFYSTNLASEDRTITALPSSFGMQSDRESTAASEALLSLAGNSAPNSGPQPPVCVFVAHPQIFALPMEPPRMMGASVPYMPQPWFPMPFGVPPPYAFGVPMPGSGPPLPPPPPHSAGQASIGMNGPAPRAPLQRVTNTSSNTKSRPQSQGPMSLQSSQPISPPGQSTQSERGSSSGKRSETEDEDEYRPDSYQSSDSQVTKARLVGSKSERHDDEDVQNNEEQARKHRRLSASDESDSMDGEEPDELSDDDEDLTEDHSNRALDRIMFKYPKIPPPELRGVGLSARPVPISRDPFSTPDRVSVIKKSPRLESRARLHIKGVQQCGNTCPYEFATLIKMAEHLDKEHPTEYRKWLCPDESCIWSLLGFHKKVECARHIKGQHSNVMYKCTHCRRQFARSDSYRRHFTTAHKTLLP